jgi:hypothetical protein
MRSFGIVAAVALSLALVGSAGAAGKGKKADKKAKPVVGTVTAVKKDQDKDSGTFTIKTVAKNTGTASETTFKVTEGTKFARLTGKKVKKATPAGAGKFGDLKVGESVTVVGKANQAEEVKYLEAKKKNKKAG